MVRVDETANRTPGQSASGPASVPRASAGRRLRRPRSGHPRRLLGVALERLRQLRRSDVHPRQCACSGWADRGGHRVGLRRLRRRQLAPRDLAVAHAGRRVLRPGSPAAPSRQSLPARAERRPGPADPLPDDGRALAERLRGRAVRPPSPACGVRGLDRGAEGCAEHPVLAVDARGMAGVRAIEKSGALCPDAGVFRPGVDGQAHAGDPAVHVVAARLLALGTDRARGDGRGPCRPGDRAPGAGDFHRAGEGPLVHPGRRLGGGDLLGPAGRQKRHRPGCLADR